MLGYRTAKKYRVYKVSKVQKVFKVDQDRSYCDFCGKQLSWFENVPVISWLVLGGRTKCCRKKLPIEYPLVELGMGILFCLQSTNFNLQSITFLAIIVLLVFSMVFDLKYMILPDFSTYILIVIAAIFFHNWLSGLGAGLFLLALHVGTKGRGLGLGDVKLAVFMGLLLGWPKIVVAFYMAFVVGAIIGVTLMMLKKANRKTMVPFGPFLIGGTLVSWWFGDLILKSVKLFL